MARIPEYDPPDRQITASDKGANAFEQAGRRIGPAYNEAATLQRQAGEARAAIIRQRRWPFDMLELQRSLEETGKGTSSSTASGYGVKLSGDINHLEHEKEGGGSGPSKEDKADRKASSRSRLGNDVGATSMAAGALGKLASRMGATGQYHNSQIDPATGLDMNLMAPTPTKVLENGVLVDKNKVGAVDKLDINGQRRAETWSRTDWNNVDWNDPKNAAALQDYKNKNGGADPWGHIESRSSSTGGGGNTPYLSDSPSFGTSASGTDAYAPDSSTVRTGAGSAAPYDFWSDVTSSLGGVLRAGTTGEWPGGSKDYGGGEDTSGYADLTGEGAQ